ncbi:MAG: Tn3 family transposase [Acidimicrobiales bacterium]
MLRVAATIRYGYLPASTLVARLQASARQNQLTQAIQEYGRIIKTISILRYLDNGEHRRRIHEQLNKGESLHALCRQLFFANQGQIRRRDSGDQDLQGECLLQGPRHRTTASAPRSTRSSGMSPLEVSTQ